MPIPIIEPGPPLNTNPAPFQTVRSIVRLGHRIKSRCDTARSILATGQSPASYLLDIVQFLAKATGLLNEYRTVPGIDAVAGMAIPGYQGFLTQDCAATVIAMQQTIDGILAAIPANPDGWILVYKWTADGDVTERKFQPNQTSGVRDMLAGIAGTIG